MGVDEGPPGLGPGLLAGALGTSGDTRHTLAGALGTSEDTRHTFWPGLWGVGLVDFKMRELVEWVDRFL